MAAQEGVVNMGQVRNVPGRLSRERCTQAEAEQRGCDEALLLGRGEPLSHDMKEAAVTKL